MTDTTERDFLHYFFFAHPKVISGSDLLDFFLSEFMKYAKLVYVYLHWGSATGTGKGNKSEKSLQMMELWATNHWPSFAMDYLNLTKKLRSVRDLVMDQEKSIRIQSLMKLIHKKDKRVNKKVIDIESATLPVNFYETDPAHFARQLTLYHEDYWDKVSPLDLLQPSRHSDTSTPIGKILILLNFLEILISNTGSVINSFNKLTEWVKSVILTEVM